MRNGVYCPLVCRALFHRKHKFSFILMDFFFLCVRFCVAVLTLCHRFLFRSFFFFVIFQYFSRFRWWIEWCFCSRVKFEEFRKWNEIFAIVCQSSRFISFFFFFWFAMPPSNQFEAIIFNENIQSSKPFMIPLIAYEKQICR